MNKHSSTARGYTLIEIVVVMAISIIIVPMLYGALTEQFLSFWTIMKRNEVVEESLTLKRRVETILQSADSLEQVTTSRCVLHSENSITTLRFQQGAIYKNKELLMENIKRAEFSTYECGRAVVIHWEVELAGGHLVGGAERMKR